MLRVTRNRTDGGNALLREARLQLLTRLPPGWGAGRPEPAPAPLDATLEVSAPDRRSGSIGLIARPRLEPKEAARLVATASEARPPTVLVVVARYLSRSTRERLRDMNVSYLDLAGNSRVAIPRPGLFIETQGATKDPDRKARPSRSLRGPKVGRVVRALVDRKNAPGVREIASAAGIDAGHVSRILALLDSEAVIERGRRGRIETVDWPALLRLWAQQAPLASRGEVRTYLEPRGLPALLDRLRESGETYAVTGGLAAARLAPVAPPRLATLWMRDAAEAAGRLGLRQAEAGANVILIEPVDDGVFTGAAESGGVRYAAPSQVVADLLTSPGRGPAEGEALLEWMRDNEDRWRG